MRWDARTGAITFVKSTVTTTPVPSTGAGSTVGARVLAVVKTKMGVPYEWGGNGPNSFDCSGLTAWAYRQVGITIPRVADAQALAGTYVAKSNLQAGDLVFFYDPIAHVGIYDGKGNVLNAPDVGQNVKLTPMQYLPYTTARRYG